MIDRRVGRAGVTYGIGFELRLPADWNERLYFQGGLGTDGSIQVAGSLAGGNPLVLGYAVVSTDGGQTGGGPEIGGVLRVLACGHLDERVATSSSQWREPRSPRSAEKVSPQERLGVGERPASGVAIAAGVWPREHEALGLNHDRRIWVAAPCTSGVDRSPESF